jgi:hypothetical protein
MSSKAVLKSSFIGYIYRSLRAVGFIFTIAGLWHLGDIFYHAFTGGSAVATISRLQAVCVLQASSSMSPVVLKEVECSEAEAARAAYPGVPLSIGEISYGTFAFITEDGRTQEVRAPLAALEAQGAEHGSTVSVVYNRVDPNRIRPAMPLGAILRSLSFLSGGVALLFAMLTVRWVASHRRGIEVDVARLEQSHTSHVRRNLRLPITAAGTSAAATAASARPARR